MTHLLLVLVLVQEAVPTHKGEFVIVVAGQPSDDLRRGLEFGFDELQHTARLMGRSLVLATGSSARAGAMIVASTSAPVPSGDAVARIHVGPLPSGAESCEFSVAPLDSSTDQTLVAWDARLARFGASELNERFDRAKLTPMTEAAYLGWIAVKALVEAELRRTPGQSHCQALERLRFDGHKGRPLFFDPATRTLAQPLYIVKDGKIVGETK